MSKQENGQTTQNKTTQNKTTQKANGLAVAGIIIVAVVLLFITNNAGGLNFLPEINQSMGYGILFVVGLMTSVHCIAMCGGINLSQSITKGATDKKLKGNIMPALLYNTGRVISYTIIGGIVGALGSVVSFSGRARGIVAIVAGVFMVIMALNMMNVFPWARKLLPRLPKKLSGKVHSAKRGKGPLLVGLLNGFMPCGPLQAMQIYALGTGSFVAGALSMFMFSLGTVPLMLGFGAISALLSSKFTKKLMWVSAALVLILGVIMMGRGFNQTGVSLAYKTKNVGVIAVVQEDTQEITTEMQPNYYEPFVVQAGMPVKWTINVEEGDLNGCNNPITIPKFGIEKTLEVGENIIEFTPTEQGYILYTCWMGMIDGNISVVADLSEADKEIEKSVDNPEQAVALEESSVQKNAVAANKGVGVAKIIDDVQTISVTVDEYGFSPEIIVLQKDVPTEWMINGETLTGCNNSLVFPAYGAKLDLVQGENVVNLMPSEDFGYSCWMGMIRGFVKVVDDVENIDIDAIVSEARGPSKN